MVAQLRMATARDPELSRVLLYTKTGWLIKVPPVLLPYWNRREELSVEDGCVMWGIQVVIPLNLCVLRDSSHPHGNSMYEDDS